MQFNLTLPTDPVEYLPYVGGPLLGMAVFSARKAVKACKPETIYGAGALMLLFTATSPLLWVYGAGRKTLYALGKMSGFKPPPNNLDMATSGQIVGLYGIVLGSAIFFCFGAALMKGAVEDYTRIQELKIQNSK